MRGCPLFPRGRVKPGAIRAALILFLGLAVGGHARAQESEMSVTEHEITLEGKTLHYHARAGFIPIRDNVTGAVLGKMFFVAYTADRSPDAPPRPVTFAWNGGPGSNALLVHMVGFGPRRIRNGEDPAQPSQVPPALEDNAATWLSSTDLVFVDPIGTGFSRPTEARYAPDFYGVLEDIAAVAEFVRVYRLRYVAPGAPLFLAGESYGVWRAAGVAETLEKHGRKVAGVLLFSGGIPFGPVAPTPVRTALFVPGRTAAAFYHHALSPDLQRDLPSTLQEAETWALETYAPALAERRRLTDVQRRRIVGELARFTGLAPGDIDPQTLATTSPEFRSDLLRDRHLTLGRYDMRLTGQSPSSIHDALVRRYLRNELGFTSDLAYQGLERGYSAGGSVPSVGERWAWDQAPPDAPPANAGSGDGPPGGSQPWLRRAMDLDPDLRAFVAAGLYDSLNSCAENRWVVAHVPARYGRRTTARCYEGGHMMYEVATVRRRLQRDVARFIRGVAPDSAAPDIR